MDRIETLKLIKSEIRKLDSNNAHKEIAPKLADPNDAVILPEQRKYEKAQTLMDDKKQ